MSRHIQNLISPGEHQQLDFKFEISDSRKIARTLVAFSNTDGGKLLIGVKDNGAIAGVRSEEEFYMVEAAASMYCKPRVEFEVKEWEINGKTVLEVDIPRRGDGPFYAQDEEGRWMAYIRVKDENLLANSVWLKLLRRKRKSRGSLPKCSFSKIHVKPLPSGYPREITSLGDAIRATRLDLGWDHNKLAMNAGVSQCTITNWELGHTYPKGNLLKRISEFLCTEQDGQV